MAIFSAHTASPPPPSRTPASLTTLQSIRFDSPANNVGRWPASREYRIFQVICKQMAPTGNLDRPVTTESGLRVIGYTDNAARRSCPTSLLRNAGSSYSEEPGMEIL